VQPGARPVHVGVSGRLPRLGVADWHRPATGGGNFRSSRARKGVRAPQHGHNTTAAAAADARLDSEMMVVAGLAPGRLVGESGGKLATKSTPGA
jgi:hypothetical protein